jgi:hypothetical protein
LKKGRIRKMTFDEWWAKEGHEHIEGAYTHTEYVEIEKIANKAWIGALFWGSVNEAGTDIVDGLK